MKKFTISIAAILLFSVSIFAQNLIENPGFEAWTGDVLDSWEFNDVTMQLTQNTTDVHTGNASCGVLFTSQEQSQVNLLSNTFAVESGADLVTSAWFLDNDPAGRATISIIFDVSNMYSEIYTEDSDSWQELSFTSVVPDGASTAQIQIRFYDISANWVDDCEILIDDASFIIDNTIHPEPSNYPTNFAAQASGISAFTSWTDAIGDQLPQNYVVYASTSDAFTAPVDGTPVDDDADMSDGSAVINVSFGDESASFIGFDAGASYYFTIYPYTNNGTDIDFKTDGTAPVANLVMPDVSVISAVDFEDGTFGDWITYSVVGNQVWEVSPEYGNPGACAKMTGYAGAPFDNEDWLIYPAFDLDDYVGEVFTFETAMNYDGPAMELLISSDYVSGDPSTAAWEALSFTPSDGNWNWQASGDVDLSTYSGTVSLGFKFLSTNSGSATWEIDNILITGTMSNSVQDEDLVNLSVYPNPSNGIYQIVNSNSQNFEITVFNILGKQIMETIEASNSHTLNIQDFDNGVYFLQIMTNNQKKIVSVIKR